MRGIRIVWPEAGRADLEEFELGEPGDHEVLIDTEYSVLSAGTEKAWLAGMPNTSNVFPQYPGYSSSGRIIEIGGAVREFKVGDRVAAYHSPHSSLAIKNVADLVRIDDDSIPGGEAAFVIIAAMSLHGVRKAGIELGESVMVIGLGLLGIFAVQLARLNGALPVIAVDFNEQRLQMASSLGADHAMSPAAGNFKDMLKSLTGGKGVDAVIEVSGNPEAMNMALRSSARGGRVVALGCTRHKVDGVDFYRDIHLPGVSVVGAHNMVRPTFDSTPGHWTMRDDMRVLLKMISAGRLKVGEMISKTVSPDKAPEVYDELMRSKEPPLGVVFNWCD